MTETFERRGFELRQAGDGGRTLFGTAVHYGAQSRIIPGLMEEWAAGSAEVRPGAIANVAHDRSRPLARHGIGLRFIDGPEALRAEIDLPATADGNDVLELVRIGVFRGFSLEFLATAEDWPTPGHRIIRSAQIAGVAVVDDPAAAGATIDEVRARLADAEAADALAAANRVAACLVWT